MVVCKSGSFTERGITSHSWKLHFAQLILTCCCYKARWKPGSTSHSWAPQERKKMKQDLVCILENTLLGDHLLSNIVVAWQIAVLRHSITTAPAKGTPRVEYESSVTVMQPEQSLRSFSLCSCRARHCLKVLSRLNSCSCAKHLAGCHLVFL